MEDEREGGADIPFISAYVMSDPESELRLKSIIGPLVRRYPIPSQLQVGKILPIVNWLFI
jgi:hypothetical protein